MGGLLLGLYVLDRQLVDRDGVLCGKVDNLLLRWDGRELRLCDLVTGWGAWPLRLPGWARGFGWRLLGDHPARVGWQEVQDVDSAVRISIAAAELTARAEALRRPPPGTLLLSQVLGIPVRDPDGRPLGRVRDVEVERRGSSPRALRLLVGTRFSWRARTSVPPTPEHLETP